MLSTWPRERSCPYGDNMCNISGRPLCYYEPTHIVMSLYVAYGSKAPPDTWKPNPRPGFLVCFDCHYDYMINELSGKDSLL